MNNNLNILPNLISKTLKRVAAQIVSLKGHIGEIATFRRPCNREGNPHQRYATDWLRLHFQDAIIL